MSRNLKTDWLCAALETSVTLRPFEDVRVIAQGDPKFELILADIRINLFGPVRQNVPTPH